MTLFEECQQALGKEITILSDIETKSMFKRFVTDFPVTSWGRVDWDNIFFKKFVTNVSEIIPYLKERMGTDFDSKVYLLWNYSDASSVIAQLSKVIEVIDDVTAVGSDTWLYDPEKGYVIEFFHEGQITVGMKKSI